MFREFDRRHLYDDYAHYSDQQKLQVLARKRSEELKELFEQDETDRSDAVVDADNKVV